MANNQGIDHISHKNGGLPLCHNQRAYMSISIERYAADDGTGRYCARCVARVQAMSGWRKATPKQEIA